MNLLELAEPLFQYICRLNRLARRSGAGARGDTVFMTKSGPSRASSLDYAVVRSEVKGMIEEFLQKGGQDPRLSSQSKKMELPLIFFLDSMVAESSLPFAAQWNQNRMAYERNELAGDEKFFDLLEAELKESGEDVAERLALFYVCLGLGFTGIYFRQPEYLRKSMLTIAPRIRQWMEGDQMARICPEAYEGVDTRNLVQPPGSKLVFIALLFLCFSLAMIGTYFLLYRQASKDLSSAFEQILQQNPAPQPRNKI